MEEELIIETQHLGRLLTQLRLARKVKQSDASLNSGVSRSTIYRIEKGDPGVALGQLLRYLKAIAPGSTLQDLLSAADPTLQSPADKRHRVRGGGAADLPQL
jgi:transcriptional regulator with XRE-family HTH domain